MHRKIIYLVNPVSGTKGRSTLIKLITAKTEAARLEYLLATTNSDGNYQSLKKQIIEDGFTDIVVCGGDGTISAVAAALLGTDVRIGIIPMGSGNGLALSAGIPSSPAKAMDIIIKGEASWINGFFINEYFSCMLAGIGFDAKVAHDFAKEKTRGLQTYIKTSLRNFISARPYPFLVQTGQQSFSADAFFISIANSNQFGNNFTIAPFANLQDGLLDVVIVKKMNKLLLPFSILGQLLGINTMQDIRKNLKPANIIYFQAATLTVQNSRQALLHIDGDPKETASAFRIRIVERAINLIHQARH